MRLGANLASMPTQLWTLYVAIRKELRPAGASPGRSSRTSTPSASGSIPLLVSVLSGKSATLSLPRSCRCSTCPAGLAAEQLVGGPAQAGGYHRDPDRDCDAGG